MFHLEFPWALEHTSDIHDWQWGLIMTLGAVIGLLVVVKFVIPTMIQPILTSRREAIVHNSEQVQSTMTEVAQMRDDFRQRLEGIEGETKRRMDDAVHEADALRETILTEARQQAAAILRRGEDDVSRERAKAQLQVRSQFVDDVIRAAEFAASRSLDAGRQQSLVTDFVQKITNTGPAT